MFSLPTLSLFLAAAVGLILSPGPDSIYVLTRSVGHGRNAGIHSAFGVSTGVLVHTTAAAVGLSAVLQASPVAYTAVKYAGAVYLTYLGVRTFRNQDVITVEHETSDARNPYAQGVLVNILNPQIAVFFLAFLPQFVDSASGAFGASTKMLALGGIYATLTAVYLSAVAAAAGSIRTVLTARPKLSHSLRWTTGVVLVALGLRMLIAG